MKGKTIHVERLELKLPRASRSQAKWNSDSGERLARSVAAGLAGILKQDNIAPGEHSLRAVHVTAPREQADAEGIARAIHAALGRALPAARKES